MPKDIVSCFVEHDGRFILLHRHSHKSQGNTWGMPAGKQEAGESVERSTIREVEEETGLKIEPKRMEYLGNVLVRYPGYDYRYHISRVVLDEEPRVKINIQEHKDFRWLTPREALAMPDLMPDLDACIKLHYPS